MGNVHEERLPPEINPWFCLDLNPWLELWDSSFAEPTELNDPWPMQEWAHTAPPDGGPSGGLGAGGSNDCDDHVVVAPEVAVFGCVYADEIPLGFPLGDVEARVEARLLELEEIEQHSDLLELEE